MKKKRVKSLYILLRDAIALFLKKNNIENVVVELSSNNISYV